MKILMFGWEFPPFNAGGLGTACHGLTKGLKNHDVDITFVLPKAMGDGNIESSHVNVLVADNLFLKDSNMKIKMVNSILAEYITSEAYDEKIARFKKLENMSKSIGGNLYGSNLFDEVYRYSQKAELVAEYEEHDLIHAHDWMTYQAGINAKKISKKPLIVHCHATEFDRTCGHPNQYVYDIEREGFHTADKIITVSNFTKNKIVEHYGVPPEKIEVVHNGVDFEESASGCLDGEKKGKTVLYLGRMTIQKGPEYFLYAAKRVIEHDPDVRFVMAGGGDMEKYLIDKAAELGIAKNVLFTGFLRGNDINKAYRMSDLFIMPSVSEPFGITPLEAMRNGTPCIISKNSGISEILTHCFKTDFWDIDMMSNLIISTLKYRCVYDELSKNASREVYKHNWAVAANKCMEVYRGVLDTHYSNIAKNS